MNATTQLEQALRVCRDVLLSPPVLNPEATIRIIDEALSALTSPSADLDEAGSTGQTETPVVEASGGLKTDAERADRLDYLAGLLDNDVVLSHNIELQIAGWLQTYAFQLRNPKSAETPDDVQKSFAVLRVLHAQSAEDRAKEGRHELALIHADALKLLDYCEQLHAQNVSAETLCPHCKKVALYPGDNTCFQCFKKRLRNISAETPRGWVTDLPAKWRDAYKHLTHESDWHAHMNTAFKQCADQLEVALSSLPKPAGLSDLPRDALALIAAERRRQISVEGWTPEHDDEHDDGSLAQAAVCYASARRTTTGKSQLFWPWNNAWWKPTPNDRVRELVKAGALIVAEIERMQRASKPNAGKERESIPLHPKALAAVAIDRAAERARFPDEAFNDWLDDTISDAGHTVRDTITNLADAWAAWYSHDAYQPDEHPLVMPWDEVTPPITPQDKAAPSTLDAGAAWVWDAAGRCGTVVQSVSANGWASVGIPSLSRSHVLGMLEKIHSGEIVGDKAHRWLGWAQAAMVAAGITNLADMKDVNHRASLASTQNADGGKSANQSRCTHKNQAWNLRFTKGVCKDCHADLPADAGQED